MITATNIVGTIIASKENWASVTNYVERILKMKKRVLEAAEHIGVPAKITLTHVSDEIRNRNLD